MNNEIQEIFTNFLKEELDQLSDEAIRTAIFIFIYMIKKNESSVEIDIEELINGTCIDQEEPNQPIFIAPTGLNICGIVSALFELQACEVFNFTDIQHGQENFGVEINTNAINFNYYQPTHEDPQQNKKA